MAKKTDNLSIIDKELTIEGIVSTTGKILIRGTLKGTLKGEAAIVAEGGSVYADIEVGNLTVGGVCEGDIHVSDKLIILSSGALTGSVVCKDLVVEAGGILNAQVNCVAFSERQPEKPSLLSIRKLLPV